MNGSVELDFARGRSRRLALGGGTLGFFGLGAWIVIGAVRASGAQHGLAAALLATTLPLALALSIALPPWLLRRRAPRPAKLEWDRDTIVERDAEAIRTAIRWQVARARVERGPKGALVQITDPDGRAITVAEHAATPRWLSRRRASADDLSTLIARLTDRDPGPAIEPDDRDARRPIMGAQVAVVTIAMGVVGVPAMAFAIPALAAPFAALVVAILCALPVLRPLHELAALIGEDRRFDRAEDATIEEAGPAPIVRRADGSFVRIDPTPAKHPDALLGSREDLRVRVVLPLSGWIAARTRASVPEQPVAIDAIETVHEQTARAELVRAAAIELALRALAVLFWGAMSISPLWLG